MYLLWITSVFYRNDSQPHWTKHMLRDENAEKSSLFGAKGFLNSQGVYVLSAFGTITTTSGLGKPKLYCNRN